MQIALLHHRGGEPRRTRRAERLAHVLSQRGHALSLHDSDGFEASVHAPEADLICICGGDGTVRRALDRQKSLRDLPPIAIYPTGTINLLSRELQYPAACEAFARRIERRDASRTTNVARIGEQRFFACASMGIDALAVARVSLALKARIGRYAYVHSISRMLLDWPRHKFKVCADGEELEAEALFLPRCRYYAGPWTLDRATTLDSDRLHVLALPRADYSSISRLGFHALTGGRLPAKEWRFLRVSQLHVRSAEDFPVQADGDILTSTPVDISISQETVRWA